MHYNRSHQTNHRIARRQAIVGNQRDKREMQKWQNYIADRIGIVNGCLVIITSYFAAPKLPDCDTVHIV